MQEPQMGIYKPKDQGFAKFIWNGEKGEFLGRTGLSWIKIIVFYIIFYTFLAGFFSAMMAVLYQTLDTENRPTYTPGNGGSVLSNPAMGFRPRPRKANIESTLIWYENSNPKDIEHWVNELNMFIKDYEGIGDDGQHIRTCSFEDYEKEKKDQLAGAKRDDRACKFEDKWLAGDCNKANFWGYNRDSPCVILKLNRMIDWEPELYEDLSELPENMPEPLKATIRNKTAAYNNKIPPVVWVSCEGENPADKEYLRDIKLYPEDGFPAYYFPYTKVPGYRSPLVGVMLHDPEPNVLINIECRIWAKNIVHDRKHRLGMVHFELLKD